MRVYNNHVYHAVSYISSNSFFWLVLRTMHSSTSKKTIAALFSTLLGLDLNWACGIKFSVLLCLGHVVKEETLGRFSGHIKNKLKVCTYPICSMYGIFTYIWVILLGRMLVNIPAPWSIWVWYLANKKAYWDPLQDSTTFTSKGRQCSVSWFWMRTSLRPKTQNAKTCSKHISYISNVKNHSSKKFFSASRGSIGCSLRHISGNIQSGANHPWTIGVSTMGIPRNNPVIRPD